MEIQDMFLERIFLQQSLQFLWTLVKHSTTNKNSKRIPEKIRNNFVQENVEHKNKT